MKPNHLFTSMLALATIVVTSCSAPRLAQQSNNDDDVYNSVAQAKVYTPAPVPVQQTQNNASNQYNEDDYYGTSDPYYDMDYSSRINRFYYSSPWRTYYDPYFDNWSMGIGFGSYYGGWNTPYSGWGYLSSPFWGWNNWGFNNWGWNNWGWNNYYGGGYYGGGYYGGGFLGGGYGGGGYYTGRTTNVPQSVRPARGSRDGYTPGRSSTAAGSEAYLSPRSSAARAARQSGSTTTTDPRSGTVSRPSRTSTTQSNTPSRTETARPSRESYTPPAYSPPPTRSSSGSSGSSGSSSSGSSGSSGGGGSTGGGRASRGGR